ncbi:MAG: DUF3473 domain-containing protein [Elusimicrobia bacterium]|nr:DUF3473 domain-containing protein [Elusimicrobiota bacterium]
MTDALSIDVEDYFMASAFEPFVPRSDWDRKECRVLSSTYKILSILDEFETKATFFVLGWVGERRPKLVREIHARGHEVACHGYDHRLIYHQDAGEFRADVRKAKRLLEDACGAPVVGYRAPSFSVVRDTRWALDVLAEEGFLYDASVLPARHARGGMEGAHRFPHQLSRLAEFPMSTVRLFGKTIPFSGGGYFRLFPYPFTRWGIRACHREGNPSIVYLHPWEFDPGQPRLKARWMDRFRHTVNLHKTEEKFRRLLKDFRFGTVRGVLEDCLGRGAGEALAGTSKRRFFSENRLFVE